MALYPQEDIILQLQAMRISVEQVESSRCQVLREELDRDRLAQLANQREELASEYDERIRSLEKSWSDRMDQLQQEIRDGDLATGTGRDPLHISNHDKFVLI